MPPAVALPPPVARKRSHPAIPPLPFVGFSALSRRHRFTHVEMLEELKSKLDSEIERLAHELQVVLPKAIGFLTEFDSELSRALVNSDPKDAQFPLK